MIAADVVATVGIIRLEILSGARTEAEYGAIERRLTALRLLPVIEEDWRAASRLSFALRRVGITLPSMDLLIATVAIRAGATLVHRDRHFDVIAGHSALKVESYV